MSGPSPCVRLSVIIALAVVTAVACAGRRPPQVPAGTIAAMNDLSQADRLVRDGCYACLREAATLYERTLAAEPLWTDVRRRLVDTLFLLAMRERELGLGQGVSLARARDEAARLPPPSDVSVYEAVVEATGWRTGGVSREQQDTIFDVQARVSRSWKTWRAALLAGAGSDVLSQYQLLSFDCLNAYRLREARLEAWKPPPGSPPLLQFRTAVCGPWDRAALTALLQAVPAFAEAHLYLGEIALAAGTLRTSEVHLLSATAAMPDLVAGRALLGQVYQLMEDTEAALEMYTSVVTDVPGHREGLLGQARALSQLGRSEDAIRVLDRMVDLGTWYLGEAHYWRAWNRHRLKQFDAAHDDVLAARLRLPMDPQVDKLAGLVALARNEVEGAEREFRAAVEHLAGRGQRDCDAGYYLASTLVMQREWAEGAALFEAGVPCYTLDETAVRARMAEIAASELPPARKARLTASKQKDIVSLQAQQARAALNAAIAYVNLGAPDKARPLAERAAVSPDLAEQARVLLERIRAARPPG